jgi:hypothetical protein
LTLFYWRGNDGILRKIHRVQLTWHANPSGDQYASRWLFGFHPASALLFPLAVISLWCCLARALYRYAVHGTVLWKDRAVKVRGLAR